MKKYFCDVCGAELPDGPRQAAGAARSAKKGKGCCVMNVMLRPSGPYPCCGRPIKTSDPDRLLVLSWLAELERKIGGNDGTTDN